MYSRLRKAVGDVNVIVPTYPGKLMRDVQMNSGTGTVAFGSDLRGWGFNIERFATICATNMDMDMDKMMQRMRGRFLFQRHEQDLDQCPAARGCPRSLSSCLVLCQFIMGTRDQLMHATMNDDTRR